MPIDPALFYSAIVASLAVAGTAGYFINNGKARRALTFARSTLGVLSSCDAAIRDGTVSPEDERAVGRVTIQAYKDGGETLKALIPQE